MRGIALIVFRSDFTRREFKQKFNEDHVAPMCERTAPASFKYDSPIHLVLPVKKVPYYGEEINVPAQVRCLSTRYFSFKLKLRLCITGGKVHRELLWRRLAYSPKAISLGLRR